MKGTLDGAALQGGACAADSASGSGSAPACRSTGCCSTPGCPTRPSLVRPGRRVRAPRRKSLAGAGLRRRHQAAGAQGAVARAGSRPAVDRRAERGRPADGAPARGDRARHPRHRVRHAWARAAGSSEGRLELSTQDISPRAGAAAAGPRRAAWPAARPGELAAAAFGAAGRARRPGHRSISATCGWRRSRCSTCRRRRWSGPMTLHHPGAPRLLELLGVPGTASWLGDGSFSADRPGRRRARPDRAGQLRTGRRRARAPAASWRWRGGRSLAGSRRRRCRCRWSIPARPIRCRSVRSGTVQATLQARCGRGRWSG